MGSAEAAVPQAFHPKKGIEKYTSISRSLSVFPSVYMSARKDSKATEEAFIKNAVGDLL